MHRTFLSALADPVFSLQVAPNAAVAHPAWRRARAAVLEALAAGRHVTLVGPPGSGKSLLLRNVAYTLRQAGESVHLVGQAVASGDAFAGGVLLVDEADALGTDALTILCAGAGPILFAMLPGGPERLPRHPRPACRVVLDRLTPLEVVDFVAARLAAAGRPNGLLEREAVLALARHSGGLPRMVNVLGGAAVFLAGMDDSPRVSLRHVEEAAAMRDDPAEDATSTVRSEPPPVKPSAALPSYRSPMLRRRAALGSMMAASGLLFTLPWLASKRSGSLPQGGDGRTVQVAQTEASASFPATASPIMAMAEGGAFEPLDAGGSSASLAGQPRPEVQPAVVASVPSPHTALALRTAPALPVAPPGDRRAVVASDAPVLFRGPIFNETMRQGGYVEVVLHRQAPTGAVIARFDASQGLSGTGTLAGRVSESGQMTASGQLLMGKNPFMCDLRGILNGNTLIGSASFVRNGTRTVYHSRFHLVRT